MLSPSRRTITRLNKQTSKTPITAYPYDEIIKNRLKYIIDGIEQYSKNVNIENIEYAKNNIYTYDYYINTMDDFLNLPLSNNLKNEIRDIQRDLKFERGILEEIIDDFNKIEQKKRSLKTNRTMTGIVYMGGKKEKKKKKKVKK
jgi:hypothetical protein